MAGRPMFKLVAPLVAFAFSIGTAAPAAVGRPCRMDARQPATSQASGLSGRGATCCCDRAQVSLPAPAIAQQDQTTPTGPGAAVASATRSTFPAIASAALLHADLTGVDRGPAIPILLLTRSLLI